EMVAELTSLAPAAVPFFKEANEARDKGRFEDAQKLYLQVARQAPSFDAAPRRAASCLMGLGKASEAVPSLEDLYHRSATPLNAAALASALRQTAAKGPEGAAMRAKAMELAVSAAQGPNPDESVVFLVAQL